MSYTTRANVENFLRTTFDGTTTPTDTYVDTLVSDIDEEVDRITGSTWTSNSATDIFDIPSATNRFLLTNYPVISVSSVEYNDYTNTDPEFNPNWVAVDNWRLDGNLVITQKNYQGQQKVRVQYNYGHTTVPTSVQFLATLLVVKKILSSDDAANSGTESLSIGSLSLTTNVGSSRLVNLDSMIDNQIRRVGTYKTVFRSK